MSLLTPATHGLAELMAAAPRGPRRDGLFALWLVTRVIEDLPVEGAADRPFRKRVGLVEKRLTSLMLQPPIRRGVSTALTALATANRSDGARLFNQLATAVRDGTAAEVAELLTRAARAHR